MRSKRSTKVTTTLVNGQTQYVSPGGANGIDLDKVDLFSLTVHHPGGSTTTAYTVQGSNLTKEEILAGEDDWFDYTDISPGSKTAEEKFGVGWVDFEFLRVRLKAVTSAGGGACVVRQLVKGPK